MALLIGGSASNNFGEKYFIAKAMDYFDDNTVIYWNRQLYGREFDVCILLPGKGILVLELKGWKEETVLGIGNNDSIIIDTGESQIYVNPQKQSPRISFLYRTLYQTKYWEISSCISYGLFAPDNAKFLCSKAA